MKRLQQMMRGEWRTDIPWTRKSLDARLLNREGDKLNRIDPHRIVTGHRMGGIHGRVSRPHRRYRTPLDTPTQLLRPARRTGQRVLATPLRHPSETRTRGPFSFRKGTATVAFREFGNECGVVALSLILWLQTESRFSGQMRMIDTI